MPTTRSVKLLLDINELLMDVSAFIHIKANLETLTPASEERLLEPLGTIYNILQAFSKPLEGGHEHGGRIR